MVMVFIRKLEFFKNYRNKILLLTYTVNKGRGWYYALFFCLTAEYQERSCLNRHCVNHNRGKGIVW